MITIARAEERHIDGICEIEKKCFAVPWSRASFESEFNGNPARYFAAFRELIIVAYCGYWSIVDEGHITNIAVDPSHRRCGIGAGLISAMLDDMRVSGLYKATLEVRTDNCEAISLYERFGFESVGVRKNYYEREKKDAIIMWLSL